MSLAAVSKDALYRVLAALNGATPSIRDLQAMRFAISDNPIDLLIDEYNAQFDSPIPMLRARRATGWISTKDQLPDNNTDVLILDRDGEINVARYAPQARGNFPWDSPCYAWGADHVTHWMPLPAAPKEGTDQ